MSDYTPITGELRANMQKWGWVAEDGGVTFGNCAPPNIDAEPVLAIYGNSFDRLCDAIDAIHEQLERENAALKAATAHAYVAGCEHAERDGWVELPKDADGVPIHVGDMLAGEKAGGFGLCEPFEVGCILFGRDIVQVNDVHGLARCAEFAHHYVPDTWERIIEDVRRRTSDYYCNNIPCDFREMAEEMVARCRALCERTKGDA